MKNLKEYIIEGIFDTDEDTIDESIKDQIKRFLEDNFREASSCKISDKPNADGKYEVSSLRDVVVKNKKITSLTNGLFIWTEVGGDFDCSYCNSLTSLEGAPKKVGGFFDCRYCDLLKSLKGSPKEVKKDFYCGGCNSLTSLEGAPKKVGGDFRCSGCYSLKSLKGAPKEVGGTFSCVNCHIVFTTDDVKKVSKVRGNIHV